MRTVNIGVLKNQLSAYLQYVRNGEEVVVRDRNKPIARILPFPAATDTDADFDFEAHQAHLIATGQMKEAKQKMDWEAFWALPAPSVSDEAVKEAIEWAKGDHDFDHARRRLVKADKEGYTSSMRNEFTAVIEQDGEWFVSWSPEIPGANGQGRTVEECRASLSAAIQLILEDRREDGLRGIPPEAIQETVTVQ
jgi:predicted RNase H-like HicB family nuclease/antitoxin (DNA-binding transcriptional repressor) of toxin-antitoxin stability system